MAWPYPPLPSFLTEVAYTELLANGHRTAGGDQFDPKPVVKIFTPDAGATWLLTEIDPDDETRAFGLSDLGLGTPELGWVSLTELAELLGPFGLAVERDEWFVPSMSIAAYAADARNEGRIAA